ncbi:hypothetical protein [Bradyrhizobium sp. Ghvi]|uniref:hypothetical protein n=1 Tax=Bradyrhizobium sp. Ghvi TaxID=1855319 RepID=UPI0011786516|nr:hypothetical protein [Bradyrhizobium sp. Ghvi]
MEIHKARHAALLSISGEMREARSALENDKARLREMELSNHPQIEHVRAKVERSREILTKLVERVEALGSPWKTALALGDNLRSYVRSNAAGGFQIYQGAVPQLRNGETALDGMQRAARRVRELLADRREVKAAPLPASVAKQLAREQLEARIAAAKPDVTNLIDHGGAIRFPMSGTAIEQHGGSADLYAVDAIGLLSWLFLVDMAAAIDREIDAMAEDENALSVEERVKRLAQIDADILASEREEAAFAELAGVLPRPDIDPRAALGLADTMPAPMRD